ncbi:MAG: DUF4097 family beta strand repeat protein [Candidatus Hydrogenedentes bacterium]|nr:DUF4097 family beta strand repeat protein [Candidatus Hydrogenedentota bacterium]
MNRRTFFGAGLMVLAYFFVSAPAHADASWLDSIGSILDETARWLNRVGEKSEDYLAPNYNILSGLEANDFSDLSVYSHKIEKPFQAPPNSLVSISNRFGGIRVSVWDNQVVSVVAKVTVGASSSDIASQVARGVDVRSASTDGRLELSTIEPDTRELGRVQIVVDYELTIPRDASVDCKNTWGDISVSGVGGTLRADCMYGRVDIADLAGVATVRAHGELPLKATGLRQGGHFDLSGTLAEFRNISGALSVTSSMAAIELHELGETSSVDVSNNSGGIALYVSETGTPDISASTAFGSIRSDIALEQTTRGNLAFARNANPASRQRVQLFTSFNDILVRREGSAAAIAGPPNVDGTQPFEDPVTRDAAAPGGTELVLDAAVGDIRIEGVDEDVVHIKATKLVRLQTAANARAALEALDVRFVEADHRVEVHTSVVGDMASLGCSSYRIDLEIRCPRTAPVKVTSKSGHIAISGTGGATTVQQSEGSITVQHAKGPLSLKNLKGGIEAADCAGPLEASATGGTLATRAVFAKQTLACEQGKTVVDTPQGELYVRGKGGDVRIIALGGIGGPYDVQVEGGNLSLALPEAADAQLRIESKRGKVRINKTGVSLTGKVAAENDQFDGVLGKGQFTLILKTDGGDIILD